MSSVVRGKSFDATAAVTTTIADTIDQVTVVLTFAESCISESLLQVKTLHILQQFTREMVQVIIQ